MAIPHGRTAEAGAESSVRLKRHRISQERLCAILGLPHDATIVAVVIEPGTLEVTVTSTSQSYPETPEGFVAEVFPIPHQTLR